MLLAKERWSSHKKTLAQPREGKNHFLIAGGISTYASENFSSFLTGNIDINDDAAWNTYLEGFNTHNLPRVLEIRQDCYDRYLAR